MTLGIQIIDDASPVLKGIEDGLPSVLERGLLRAGVHVAGEIRRQILQTFGGRGNRTTGNLAKSFKVSLLHSRETGVGVGVLSDLEYAGVQNRGGTIRPKGAALTVPIGAGKSLALGTRARDVPGLVMIKRPGKPPLLVKPGKKRFTLYYVLAKSVRIKPTGYIEAAAEASEEDAREIIDDAVQALIDARDR